MGMADSQLHSDSPELLQPILDLLVSTGYVPARSSDLAPAKKIAGGLSWCVSAVNAVGHKSDVISEPLNLEDESKDGKGIEESIRSIGCPHPLHASQIQNLDCEHVFPVVEWIVNRLQTTQEDSKNEATCSEDFMGDEKLSLLQLEEDLSKIEHSVNTLTVKLFEQNERKVNLLNGMQHLREKVPEGADSTVQRLMALIKLLKALEKQESDLQSHCKAKQSELHAEVSGLETKTMSGSDSKDIVDFFNDSLCNSLEKMNLKKMELAERLRAILLLKRQLDAVPSPSELIQYERRFSELYVHIQEKLGKTRKYYATYNALLEIKEFMLKETSLLSSISSQFQDAITTTAGRMKLVDSMESIVKGTQQKLEKEQLGFQEVQKVRDNLKESYAAAITEQRRCYSLLKAFQEECRRNEKLRSLTSV